MKRLAFASFAVFAASLCACNGPPRVEVARNISGTVESPAGHQIAQVEAVSQYADWDNGGEAATVYTSLDESGQFELLVYGGGAVRIAFMELGDSIGVLQFPRKYGDATTLLHITEEPAPAIQPKNGPGSGGEEEVQIQYVKTGIKLGTISDADGDGIFEATVNPLGQVDYDGDGTADLLDDDSDNDGVTDKIDTDLDDDGQNDLEENNDLDHNGFPDEDSF